MTPEAQELLNLLENLDHTDKAVCDEVNARFWCWRNGYIFKQMLNNKYSFCDAPFSYYENDNGYAQKRVVSFPLQITHNLNAIKAVEESELEGWYFMTKHCFLKNNYFCQATNADEILYAGALPTEQIARLHTLIQAIDYKRSLR